VAHHHFEQVRIAQSQNGRGLSPFWSSVNSAKPEQIVEGVILNKSKSLKAFIGRAERCFEKLRILSNLLRESIDGALRSFNETN